MSRCMCRSCQAVTAPVLGDIVAKMGDLAGELIDLSGAMAEASAGADLLEIHRHTVAEQALLLAKMAVAISSDDLHDGGGHVRGV